MATADDKDPLDTELALERLTAALRLQYRSALGYTIVSGSVTGFSLQPLAEQLWGFAQRELEDCRRLVEKMVTLEGEPPTDLAEVPFNAVPERAIEWLIESKTETIEALQDIIPSTGHTGDSEALEHRLEHMIMRKQEQVDALQRARRSA